MIVVCLLNPGRKEASATSLIENRQPLEMVVPGDQLIQEFTADDDYARFGLYYANYSNYAQGGELHIDVEDSSKETTNFTYKIGGIFDNTILYIDYALKQGERYKVTISVDEPAQGITFFTTDAADNYGAKLSRNRQPQDSTIIMTFTQERTDAFSAWYYVMVLSLILCYAVLKLDKDVYVQKA